MATVYKRTLVNGAAAHHPKTQRAVREVADEVEDRAQQNLRQARASTQWEKIADPEHRTEIGLSRGTNRYGSVDYLVWMDGYKTGAMAIEFGHAPSGVFGPGGAYADVPTRAPSGLYILTRAAGLPAKMAFSSGMRRGKR